MIFLRMIRELNDFRKWSVDFSSRYPVDLMLSCLFFFFFNPFDCVCLCYTPHWTSLYPSPSIISFLTSHSLRWKWVKLPTLPCHPRHFIILFIPSFSCLLPPTPRSCAYMFQNMAELFMSYDLYAIPSNVWSTPNFTASYSVFHKLMLIVSEDTRTPCWRHKTYHWKHDERRSCCIF